MVTTNATHTISSLAAEMEIDVENLVQLLSKLGFKTDVADLSKKIPAAIATACLKTNAAYSAALNKQIGTGKDNHQEPVEVGGDLAEATPQKLKLKDHKGVAEMSGVTTAFVNKLATSIYEHKISLLAQKGLEDYRREQEAYDAGKLYAEIAHLKVEQQKVLELESQLNISSSRSRTQEIVDGLLGGDLQSLLDSINETQEADAIKRAERNDIIEKIKDGYVPNGEELKDPFLATQYDLLRFMAN